MLVSLSLSLSIYGWVLYLKLGSVCVTKLIGDRSESYSNPIFREFLWKYGFYDHWTFLLVLGFRFFFFFFCMDLIYISPHLFFLFFSRETIAFSFKDRRYILGRIWSIMIRVSFFFVAALKRDLSKWVSRQHWWHLWNLNYYKVGFFLSLFEEYIWLKAKSRFSFTHSYIVITYNKKVVALYSSLKVFSCDF